MDVLKEEPSFSHDHFSEVKAATTAQAQPPADASGVHLQVGGHQNKSPYLRVRLLIGSGMFFRVCCVA